MAKNDEEGFIEALTATQRMKLRAMGNDPAKSAALPGAHPPVRDRLSKLAGGGDFWDARAKALFEAARDLHVRYKVFDLHDAGDIEKLEAIETAALRGDKTVLERKWAISANGEVNFVLTWTEYTHEAEQRFKQQAREGVSAGRVEDVARTSRPRQHQVGLPDPDPDNFAGMPSLIYPEGVVPGKEVDAADSANTQVPDADSANTRVGRPPKERDEEDFQVFVPSDSDLARIRAADEEN